MDPWKILPDDQARYDQQFLQLNPVDGFITGQQARDFLLKANLPHPVLAKVWELSDINRDGKLDKREFSIAMHLIRKKLQGLEIPASLPPSILGAASSQSSTAWGSMPDILPKSAPSPPSVLGSIPGNSLPSMGIMQNLNQFPQQTQFMQPVGGTLAYTASYGGQMAQLGMLAHYDGQRSRTGSTAPINDRPASAGPGIVPTGEWAVPHNTKLKYNKIFHDLDKTRTGFLTGPQVKQLFMNSGLPQPVLAQIWALADIDKDGRLASEEFVLSMHLVEMAKQREPIPPVLPAELIPPSFRRPRGLSATSLPIPVNGSASNSSEAGSGSLDMLDNFNVQASFEDKRKENFDKGQAELERRRQAIAEMQRQEREERERREREEQERREKIRQEQERKRQAEVEIQMARQREIEEKKEEERRKIEEQREAARKEMERQRKVERQKQRRHELLIERTKVYEELAHFKTQNSGFELHNVDTDAKMKDLLQLVEETRNQVRERKEFIDGMRVNRDKILEDITKYTNDEGDLDEQLSRTRYERQAVEGKLSVLSAGGMDSMQSMLFGVQQNQDSIVEMQTKLADMEATIAVVSKEIEQKNDRIRGIQDQFQGVYEDHVRLLHDFQAKQTTVLQQQPANITDPSEEGRAWNTSQNLYPNLESMKSPHPIFQQPQTHVVASEGWADSGFSAADSGFEGTDDIWEQSPFGDVSAVPAEPTHTYVTEVRDELAKKSVIRSPSIKHDHHLSFDNDFKKTKFRKFRALYAYIAGNEDELSFQPGDIILVPDVHDGEPGWLPGEVGGRTGWLPENHVQLIDDDAGKNGSKTDKPVPKSRGNSVQSDSPAVDAAQAVGGNRRAKAIHPWNAKKETHLTFAKGEILLLQQKSGDWYLGQKENKGAQGWFPAACIEMLANDNAGDMGHENVVGELKKAFQSQSSVDGSVGKDAESHYEALFEYKSAIEGDLSFRVGEIIKVLQKDGDWWTGKVGSNIGIFPSNYVREHIVNTPQVPSPASLGKAMSQVGTEDLSKRKPEIVIAVAPYTAGGAEQISFAKGEMILVKKKTETGWWEGELQAKGKQRQLGWFPAAYVKSIGGNGIEGGTVTPSHDKGRAPAVPAGVQPAQLSTTAGIKVQAMYDYNAINPDELSFKKSDIIIILNKDDDNWWKGSLNGQQGILPSNYVQSLA